MSNVSDSANGPASGSRLDWGRASERGSAFRGLARGRGAPRGRGRASPRGGDRVPGVLSDGSGPQSKQGASGLPPRPSTNQKLPTSLPSKPAVSSLAKETAAHRSAHSGSTTTAESTSSSPTSSRSGTIPRKVIRSVVPTVTVEGSAPPGSPTSSRPPNRRKRSQSHTTKPQNNQHSNFVKAPPASHAPTPRVQPSRASNNQRPSSLVVKDVPPHLAKQHAEADDATSKDIDALVERFRAGAMTDNQPATPGGRIDWADEDDTLPDLDDLGFTTTSSIHNLAVAENVSDLISPIMMDGLKSLPEPAGLEAHTPSPRLNSKLGAGSDDAPKVDAIKEPSSSPSGEPEDESTPTATPATVEAQAIQDADTPSTEKVHSDDSDFTTPIAGERQGLAASIHAPKGSPLSQQNTKSRFPNGHSNRHPNGSTGSGTPSHGRGGSPSRFSRSGPSTPINNRFNRGNDSELRSSVHNRTHSTPPAGVSRVHASRPVLSGDAISRLARTIGGMPSHGKSASLGVEVGSTSEQ